MTIITANNFLDSSSNIDTQKAVGKIIALWGFSEATLGGILHAFNIPFTGMFAGGVAILMISFIASLTNQKGIILKSTLIVLAVKGIVSPHTPVTAYFAVMLQGILGELFFGYVKNKKIAAMIFSLLIMLFSSLQKLIILTVIFGKTFWESIDVYANFIINQLFISHENPALFHLSYLLIAMYIGQHLIVGILVGYIAGRLPSWIDETINSEEIKSVLNCCMDNSNNPIILKKKKYWWQKKSGIAFFIILFIMLGLSYFYPEVGASNVSKIIIMIIRSVIIILVWFSLLSPYLLNLFRKYINKKEKSFYKDIEEIISLFPHIKGLVKSSWKKSSELKRFKRLKIFLSTTVVLLLISDLNQLNEVDR
ncbi:MAG: hypothetical protein A2V66_00400 [Ignavibacteria bacterium RBG_13_36_8]|nr:MAG: hypothetical protein A2V66_00400 [Ignavibacteria bacterium RBG_13_36_8]